MRHAAEAHHHEELGFIRKYIFSVDHKVIGIQYTITSLCIFVIWFLLDHAAAMAACVSESAPRMVGQLLGETRMPGGIMLPEFYNQLGAMHGTIMVFLGIVPLAVGGFGNYVMPLQIGAPDMAFPKIECGKLLGLFFWRHCHAVQLFRSWGAPQSGWTSYPPLIGYCSPGTNLVADRDGVSDHIFTCSVQ